MFKREYWDMKKLKQMKAHYKKEMARVNELPADYQKVFNDVSENMMNYYGGFDGFDIWDAQYRLLDMLAEAAADGVPAENFIGGDIENFAQTFRQEVALPSWDDNFYAKKKRAINKRIARKLGGEDK